MRVIKTKGGFGKVPKAFACAILEDEKRVLCLMRRDMNGIERVLLPCVMVYSGNNPVAKMGEEFLLQTGIEAQVEGIAFEGRYNYGNKRKKAFIPLLVFAVKARRMQAKPGPGFAGFRWLSIKDALILDKKKEIRLEKWVFWLFREMLETNR